MAEQFANAASTTLNSPITALATSLVVNSAAGFPTIPNFRIIVESEIMLVTGVLGTTFTVTRGQESTTAVQHSQGVTVVHIITAGGLVQGIRDNAPLQPPQFGNLTTDVAVHSLDPIFVDLVTVNATGTKFLIQAMAAGLNDANNLTPRLRVLVDGVEQNYLGTYGNFNTIITSGIQMVVLATISGLSAGSHAFKLQASYSGTTGWTIHANTNPTREAAWLIVTPLT